MREAKKKRAETSVDLLQRAIHKVEQVLEKKNTAAALELLEHSQETAIEIGTLIETEAGKGTAAVRMLEEYCEQLYLMYEAVSGGELVNPGSVCKSLKKMLIRIENSIRNDIPTHTEVVFLPYKASMWDSLESVWRAAEKDENCDAYVVPIPYFDKNPDGTCGEMHYEGGMYPSDVPVTDYQEYNFEYRHPDVIFIHNPYDSYNHVTSVHPFFYSENLKQFTDKLVYIPYFVLGEIDPKDRQAVAGMAHFCTCPGVFNADRVIVQSENMRRIYINVLTEAAGKNTRKIWEQKILGLGSPKFDKIRNTKKRDVDIPGEWLRIIQKPNGEYRKVVLYNTSVSALLQHDIKMLEKIRDVLEIFKEEKEEVALLWRPHPLIEATISSMRPKLWREYQEIVRQYRQEAWGIYDDTADLDRALVLSDAYYGDGSSVVQLSRSIDMPVLIQNVNV